MNNQEKLSLIKQVGEEIVTEEELKKLLESEEELIAYDGIEPSGQLHIAQGLLRTIQINKLTKAGIKFKMLLADWHAMANNKMGGDLIKIQTVGKYFIEVWKACGMDLKNVEFIWASDLVKDPKYWQLVIKIGRSNVLRRFIRCAEIMGREESLDKLTGSMIIYSCMQAADIFYLNAKICQLGMDQRKVNMLAREIGPGLGFWKPVVISHHMLIGLKPPIVQTHHHPSLHDDKQKKISEINEKKLARTIAFKMSKSNPDSAIFMNDSYEEIKRKINKAYCPEGVVEENPILEYYRYILFQKFSSITVNRPKKYGGDITFNSFHDLKKLFSQRLIHPQDLKQTAIDLINQLIQPVRKHFETNKEALNLFKKVISYQITR